MQKAKTQKWNDDTNTISEYHPLKKDNERNQMLQLFQSYHLKSQSGVG